MLWKYMAIILFSAFSLVACDNGGYDTRTGDVQTDTDPGAADTDIERDTEMGAPREREMDRRTSGIRTRPQSDVESDTGIDYGPNPGTGSIPEQTSPEVGSEPGMDDTGDTTGSP